MIEINNSSTGNKTTFVDRFVERLIKECSTDVTKGMEIDSDTSAFSLFDLLSSQEFLDNVKPITHDDQFVSKLQDILYTIGFDNNKSIHLCKRMHRPLTKQNVILNDWVVLYYMRQDKKWINEYGSIEDIIQSTEDTSLRGELIAMKNEPIKVDSKGGFKEYSIREDGDNSSNNE